MAVGEARVPLLRGERPAPHAAHLDAGAAEARAAAHAALSRGAVVLTSLAAGALAGALAKTAIAPLDRAKINFQISQTPYSWRRARRWLAEVVRREGTLALWRGNSATMARIVPYAAIQFTAHEQWKRLLGVDRPHTAQASPLTHLLAGSLAGVTSQSATYPLDLARARMAVTRRDQYRSLAHVFRCVWRHEGLRTLYRGYPATVLGVIPYAGVSFFTYDSLKHKHLDYFGAAPHGLTNVAFGGAAGALGQTASYPLDIVRRRMQTSRRAPGASEASGPPAARPHHPYATIAQTLHTVYSTEGWRGFFKGLSMNWVKGPIAVGISFATYDAIRAALRDLAVSVRS